MKTKLLTTLFVLAGYLCYAQDFHPDYYHSDLKAIVLHNDGAIGKGTIRYKHPLEMQDEIYFNNKRYLPGQINGFYVDEVLWLSLKHKKKTLFMPTSHYGAITVYHYLHYLDKTEVDKSTIDKDSFMQKLDEEPINTASYVMGFKKKMSAFVEDYPELSNKIKKKEKGYNMLHYDDIVDEYNVWYEENHPETKGMEDFVNDSGM